MNYRLGSLAFTLCFLVSVLFAQDDILETYQVKKAMDKIKLDGIIDESEWQRAEVATDFWMKFPTNQDKSGVKTEIKITYDDKYIYFGVKANEEKPGFLVNSLKRDIGLREADGVAIILDPINQKTNGFYFSVSPYNSQAEGLIGGTELDLTFSWDNKWSSQTKTYDGYWTAEIAIPFSILRYDDTKKSWGINFIRSNRKSNELHTWSWIPLQFRGFDLGYLGQLIWDAPLPKTNRNYSVNPYVISTVAREEGEKPNFKPNAGLDAKVGVTSSLNLDLTVNPDFSQVDVDRQVTNLTRFSIFFPERRVFFLENDDLFSGYGIPPARPFYSRRIGSKNGTNVPILFGARLSGNISKNTRIGLLNVQTARKGDASADNFTAASFNQRVFSRSTVKGYFNQRLSTGMTDAEKLADPKAEYGRNAGLELSYSNKQGTVNGWSGNHFSFKPNTSGANQFLNFGGGYFGSNFSSFLDFTSIGRNYYADMGFVNRITNYDASRDTNIRVGTNFLYNETSYQWNFKDNPYFNRISVGSNHFYALDDKRNFNELEIVSGVEFTFKNTSEFSINNTINRLNLLFPFRFVDNEDAKPIEAKRYSFNSLGIEYTSDVRRNLIFMTEASIGTFYNADIKSISVGITGRKQPYVTFALNMEYNALEFPELYGGKESFVLFAPQLEWNFTTNLFWTTFVQYNTQADNFNINSRLQWRYRPMSDLFLVYSDDYITSTVLRNRYRGFVLKLNYWI
jgi:hypothetical protein